MENGKDSGKLIMTGSGICHVSCMAIIAIGTLWLITVEIKSLKLENLLSKDCTRMLRFRRIGDIQQAQQNVTGP
jgi:hypothetical protein